MAKGLIVVDVPKNCARCGRKFIGMKDEWICKEADKVIENVYKRPAWCPIRPMPQKDEEDCFPDEFQSGMAIGWNNCIDEILKEE